MYCTFWILIHLYVYGMLFLYFRLNVIILLSGSHLFYFFFYVINTSHEGRLYLSSWNFPWYICYGCCSSIWLLDRPVTYPREREHVEIFCAACLSVLWKCSGRTWLYLYCSNQVLWVTSEDRRKGWSFVSACYEHSEGYCCFALSCPNKLRCCKEERIKDVRSCREEKLLYTHGVLYPSFCSWDGHITSTHLQNYKLPIYLWGMNLEI